jgi:hypothetical protein
MVVTVGGGAALSKAGMGPWGFVLAGAVGSLLFPPGGQESPDPYKKLGLNTSNENTAVPVVYGTEKVGGNFYYMGGLDADSYKSGSGGGFGGKGGGGKRRGYKYYQSFGLALCQGEVDITRAWKDNDFLYYTDESSISVYRGTSDQSVNSSFDSLVDDASPMRHISHVFFDEYYLGKDTPNRGTYNFEVHHYPYNSNAGDWSRIFNYVSETTSYGGIPLKDWEGNIYLVAGQEIKVYNGEFELQRTIDTSDVLPSGLTGDEIDADIFYENGHPVIRIVYIDGGVVGDVKAVDFDANRNNLLERYYRDMTDYGAVISGSYTKCKVCNNSNYAFVVASGGGVGNADLYKFNVTSLSNSLATYDIGSSIGVNGIYDIDADENYIILLGQDGTQDRAWTLDFTASEQDEWSDIGSDRNVTCLYGEEGFLTWRQSTVHSYGYDTSDGSISERDSNDLDLSGYWDSESNELASTRTNGIFCAPDGTLIISGDGTDTAAMMLIMDANPAQVLYDMIVTKGGYTASNVDTTSLQTLSSKCVSDRTGISGVCLQRKELGQYIRDICNTIHCIEYPGDNYEFAFKAPDSSDTASTTISYSDIVSAEGEGAYDGSRMTTLLKSKDIAANRINVYYTDRLSNYKRNASFQLDNFLEQEELGEIVETEMNNNWFSNKSVAGRMGRNLFVLEQYDTDIKSMLVTGKHITLSIGDLITLPDSTTGRIISIDEPAFDTSATLQITFRVESDYLTELTDLDFEGHDYESIVVGSPSPVRPVVFEEDAILNNDTYTLGITCISEDADTVSADIYVSEDGTDYTFLKEISRFPNVADFASSCTATDKHLTVNTDAYSGTLSTKTATEQLNNYSYSLAGTLQTDQCDLANLEFLAYREVEADGDDLKLRNCHRGRDYTIGQAHTTDDVLISVGKKAYVRYQPSSVEIGKTIYIKMVGVNIKGEEENFSDVSAYTYTIKGYTRKATHVAGLELVESSTGLGSRVKTTESDVVVQWDDTNRVGGMNRTAFSEWVYGGYIAGDVDNYDVIIYDSDGTTEITTHSDIGDVNTYTYTDTQNATDFGGTASDHFWIGVVPTNPRGDVSNVAIMKQEVYRV